MAEQPVHEERVLAALAHGSIVANGLGIIAGLVIYLTQRDTKRYAAFQALQAAVYQLLTFIIVAALWIVWTILYALSFIPMIGLPESAAPPAFFWIGMGSMVIPLGVMVLLGLYGVIGAIRTFQGHDFHYVLIGNWLANSSLLNGATAEQAGASP